MRGIPWRLVACAVATAVLLDLPFPIAGPMPAWRSMFAWLALAPLLVGLLQLPVKFPDARRRWVLGWSLAAGWLTGAVWFGANCYWVYDTMHLYGGMTGPMAVVALVAFSLYLGFWFGAFALTLAVVRLATLEARFAWVGVAGIPFLWVTMEYCLARVPGFPWDLLGYSQVDNRLLMQLAPWTGVYGVSFVVALVNGSLAMAAIGPRSTWFDWLGRGAGSAVLALGFLGNVPKPAATSTAVLVQPNLDVASNDVWLGREWDRQIAQFLRLGAQSCTPYLAGIPETNAPQATQFGCTPVPAPGLIAWPESPAPFRDAEPRFQSAMRSIAAADKAPLIVGTIGMEDDPAAQRYRIYNSAEVFTQDGNVAGRYDKIRLVPFGEYVPFRKMLFFVRQVAQSMSDMNAGTERKVFRLAAPDGTAHRYGIFICYESVFGDEVRQFARLGAEVLVNISDDGWYGDTSAPWQHLNMARMRAIENRRWILRDTNNGVTAAIDPYGTVRQSIPRHEVGALAAQFGYNSEITFYTVHGDWLAWGCAVLSLGSMVLAVRALLHS